MDRIALHAFESSTALRYPFEVRALAAIMTALFLFAASLQLNDPDPLRWIALYGAASALSVAEVLGRTRFRVALLAALGFAAGALVGLPELLRARAEAFTSFHMQSLADEVARESLGLLLCALWSGLLAWRARPTGR
jgi:hypothetical protein